MQSYKDQLATIAAALDHYAEIKTRHIAPTGSTAHLHHHAHVYAYLDSLRQLIVDTMTGKPPHRRYGLPCQIVQRYDALIYKSDQDSAAPFHTEAAEATRLRRLLDQARQAPPSDNPELTGPHLTDYTPAIARNLRTILAGLPYDAIPTALRTLTAENNYPLAYLIDRLGRPFPDDTHTRT